MAAGDGNTTYIAELNLQLAQLPQIEKLGNEALYEELVDIHNAIERLAEETMAANWYHRVAAGEVEGHSVINKYGRNTLVGTSYVPISIGGVYQTPQVAGATTLRIKAGGSANDTAAGSGAREITLEGVDATGALVQEVVTTAGGSASAATSTAFIRLFRAWVSASGTYATSAAGSHSASIVIEDSAGAADWLTISATGFPTSQSAVAAYTVPLGHTAYILSASMLVDSSKSSELLLVYREGILQTSAPYSAMLVAQDWASLIRSTELDIKSDLGGFPALTDIWFMGKVTSGTAEIDISFEILLVEDGY